MKSKRLNLLIFLLIGVFISNVNAVTPPKYGGVIRYTIFQTSISLDPIKILTFNELYIADSIFDGLVRYGQDGVIFPCLASSWEISEDQKVYTFHINESAKFHNGRIITANDVKFSWERSIKLVDKSILKQSKLELISGADSFRSEKVNNVSGLKVLDNNSIQVSLEQADRSFLDGLTNPPAWIIPKESAQKSDFSLRPIGSGPFKCASSTGAEGEILHLEAYEEYLLGRPYLDGIVFIVAPDFDTALLQFETDELDCLEIPNIEFDSRFRNDPEWSSQVSSIANNQLICIQINRKAFLEKTRLVDVLKYGIDVKSILKMLYNQGKSITDDYQPEKAKKMNVEFQGKAIKLNVLNSDYDAVKIADRIAFDLIEIGVGVSVNPMNRQDFQKAINDKLYSLALQTIPQSFKDTEISNTDTCVPLFYKNMNMLQKPELQDLSDSAQSGVFQFDNMYLLHLK
jgi:ABC-type transport system substrate-binding protein